MIIYEFCIYYWDWFVFILVCVCEFDLGGSRIGFLLSVLMNISYSAYFLLLFKIKLLYFYQFRYWNYWGWVYL